MEELYSAMNEVRAKESGFRCEIIECTLDGNLKQSIYAAQCLLAAEREEYQLRAQIADRRAKTLESLGTKIAGV